MYLYPAICVGITRAQGRGKKRKKRARQQIARHAIAYDLLTRAASTCRSFSLVCVDQPPPTTTTTTDYQDYLPLRFRCHHCSTAAAAAAPPPGTDRHAVNPPGIPTWRALLTAPGTTRAAERACVRRGAPNLNRDLKLALTIANFDSNLIIIIVRTVI